ncbi:GNAT family N-acetyltransferase [Chitinophaga solisilvae]|uniref:GNAT family N-acetyltransferase n=1 Tax=Chitinophaga solisilvae TaxID=1233460 RepID=UPI0013691562|nr:GNAT family N-acetyltransferase [Chitinophaga solisilvae]
MIQESRLIYRQPTTADVQRYYDIFADPQTNLYNPFGPITGIEVAEKNIEKTIAHWAAYGFGAWAVATTEHPEDVIGFGGIQYKMYGADERLNLGYRFREASWGRGYATEMAKHAIDTAFNTLRLPEVFAIVRPVNKPSIHVLEKSGMVLTGRLDDVPGQEWSLVYKITSSR